MTNENVLYRVEKVKTLSHSTNRKIIYRNTKRMEYNFVEKNLDPNGYFIENCINNYGEKVNFIFSRKQRVLLNLLFSEITSSVMETDLSNNMNSSENRAKRIYSRKKELIKNLITLFDDGSLMLKYFKYITNTKDILSKSIKKESIRLFLIRIHNAVKHSDRLNINGVEKIILPNYFVLPLLKLNIYNEETKNRTIFNERCYNKTKK